MRQVAEGVPDGLVTFLFTDIEASTQRVQSLGQTQWLAVLEQHNAIIRHAVARHAGYEVKTEGDAFFVTFADAAQAVEACLEAQLELAAHPWPPGAPIRVRMGLHTGTAHLVDGDYVGLVVHEAARIAATGHGGQTIVSEATRLSAGLDPRRVRDLGRHALKDFPEPQRLHQLVDPRLPSSFPALRTLTAAVHNLPTAPTALVGRTEEVTSCAELLLGGTRLLTLTGPGGIGKTRLALAVAEQLLAYFPLGVWIVPLESVAKADQVIPAVNEALGVIELQDSSASEALVSRLQSGQPALVVLDNVEHLADAGLVVADLLAACGNLSVLATSRTRLRLRGEQVHAVDPLDEGSSVQLFTARAAEVQQGFALDDTSRSPVQQICGFLEGMPLAIELAAARVRELGVDGVHDGLVRSLDLLTEGPIDLPARQQALRSTIAWSVDLLGPAEQAALAQLSVFAGGMGAGSAAAVVGDGVRLHSLAEASLLRRTGHRFAMLETIRQFASERLPDIEAEGARSRHAEFFCALATKAAPQLTGPEQVTWLQRLAEDHDNLRTALDALLLRDPSSAAAMTAALGRFWEIRGFWTEARERTEAAYRTIEPQDPAMADLLHWKGRQELAAGSFDAATEAHRAALTARLRAGDLAAAGRSADALGEVARLAGDDLASQSYYESALHHFQTAGDRHGEATTMQNLGALALQQERAAAAVEHLGPAHDLFVSLDDHRGAARALLNLGLAHLLLEDDAAAEGMFDRAMAAFTELGDREGEAAVLSNLGMVASRHGDHDAALARWTEALSIERELGNAYNTALLLTNLLDIHNARNELDEALGVAREALAIRRSLGSEEAVPELLYFLGVMANHQGDPAHALALLLEAAGLRRRRGELVGESTARLVAAGIAAELGDEAKADELRLRVRACVRESADLDAHVEELLPHIGRWPQERAWLLGLPDELRAARLAAEDL